MNTTKAKCNYIDEQELNEFTIVNPIDFLTEEQNNEIINSLKQSLQDENDPSKWIPFEEFLKKIGYTKLYTL